ncbi:MAG: chemotaxis-specific protein-glutamate methyltransferase CheB [Alphaproteobacteria bacterium]
MIRILVAEDSPVQRELLIFLLEEDGAFSVVGTAKDGVEAVEMTAQLNPDIVLMDYHMPRMNGAEATRAIMSATPVPIVVTSATIVSEDVAMTFDTLRNGALSMVVKPVDLDDPGHDRQAQHLLQTLKLMAEVKVVRRWPSERPSAVQEPRSVARKRTGIACVAIGGSTGAPGVISQILSGLPTGLTAPVIIVQHMAAGFAPGFAAWLDQKAPLPVRLAEGGMLAQPGMAYIAPDAAQLSIEPNGRFRQYAGMAGDMFCPSSDHLFHSVATVYGASAMGVLLTGMGRDGVSGLRAIRTAGGVTAVQEEQSCVVFGMPGAAMQDDATDHILPPAEIAAMIAALAGGGKGVQHGQV